MFTSPGAIAIELGSVKIYWYGIFMATAYVIGLLVVSKIARDYYKEKNITEEVFDLAFCALVGGILGARLYYVLFSLDYYLANPTEIFFFRQGGLSLHGGIIGGYLTGSIYCKIKKISILKYADLYALGIPIGQAIGRWGNFFNSEAFGRPTDLPWKLYIPPVSRPENYINYEYFHPTFLYEFFWNILVFLILYFVIKKRFFDKKGITFFSYLILYSIGRLFTESLRLDSVYNFLGIPVAQWASIIMIVVGITGIVIISYKNYKTN